MAERIYKHWESLDSHAASSRVPLFSSPIPNNTDRGAQPRWQERMVAIEGLNSSQPLDRLQRSPGRPEVRPRYETALGHKREYRRDQLPSLTQTMGRASTQSVATGHRLGVVQGARNGGGAGAGAGTGTWTRTRTGTGTGTNGRGRGGRSDRRGGVERV